MLEYAGPTTGRVGRKVLPPGAASVILGAEVARQYKPHPQAYLSTVSLLQVESSQVMMVAAHNADLRGASRAGLRTAYVIRPTQFGPGQTTDLAPEGDWDVVAKDFVDLAAKLGA